MNVTDDVERTVFLPFVIPQRHPLNHGRFDLFGAFNHEHMAESLPSQATKGPAKLGVLLTNDVGSEVPFAPRTVAIMAQPLGEVQNDGDWKAVVLPSKLDQRLAGFGLHVRSVDHRQPAQS